jgi:glycosyltransferase involved in cell wall biosynthesis
VEIFNLPIYREGFLSGYPNLNLPVRFDELANLPEICRQFDAVIATHNPTVKWLLPVQEQIPNLILGYYIQGFEPLMYQKGMRGYSEAMASYTLIPKMVRFTKTEWTRNEVLKHTGADPRLIGVDVDFDLFRPRPDPLRERPDHPLRIAAMIRPETPYREPEKTMQLLKLAHKTYGGLIEPVIFGTTANNSGFLELTNDFPWKLYGVLSSQKVANLLNTADIFIDYSSHQAMGLTALEAMAAGCAVIVPQNGGATSFCHNMENGMITDTSDFKAVWQTLQKLITDEGLRQKIQKQAIYDACKYSPERVAWNILDCLFGER